MDENEDALLRDTRKMMENFTAASEALSAGIDENLIYTAVARAETHAALTVLLEALELLSDYAQDEFAARLRFEKYRSAILIHNLTKLEISDAALAARVQQLAEKKRILMDEDWESDDS